MASIFPVFCVEQRRIGEASAVVGAVTRTTHGGESWVKDGGFGFLKIGAKLVAGGWRDHGERWEFAPEDAGCVASILAHHECEVLDGYWGERAELVMDETLRWERVEFQPRDAIRLQGPGGALLSPVDAIADGSMPPAHSPGGEVGAVHVVPAGWDHEHCAICWETIGRGGQVEGHVSSQGDWVCSSCYDFVERRSLDFIPSP